jgi:hypothetical protein
MATAAGDSYMPSIGPAQTFVKERRSSVRENVSIPAKLAFQNKTLDVTVIDLTERGLALRSSVMPDSGACVEIHISLPGSTERIQCNGIIAWATKEMAGIEFSSTSENFADALEQWLDRQCKK